MEEAKTKERAGVTFLASGGVGEACSKASS